MDQSEKERDWEKFNANFPNSRDLYLHLIKGQGGPEALGPWSTQDHAWFPHVGCWYCMNTNPFYSFSLLPCFLGSSMRPSTSDTSLVSYAHGAWLKLGTQSNVTVLDLTSLFFRCQLIKLITRNLLYRERKSWTVPKNGSNWTWIICPNDFHHSWTSLPLFSTFPCYFEPYQIPNSITYNLWRVLKVSPISYRNLSKCI